METTTAEENLLKNFKLPVTEEQREKEARAKRYKEQSKIWEEEMREVERLVDSDWLIPKECESFDIVSNPKIGWFKKEKNGSYRWLHPYEYRRNYPIESDYCSWPGHLRD